MTFVKDYFQKPDVFNFNQCDVSFQTSFKKKLDIWIFEYFEYSEQCVNRVGELKREMICLGYFARPLFDKANDSVDKNACE